MKRKDIPFEYILKRLDEGFSQADIAKELNVTPAAVCQAIKRQEKAIEKSKERAYRMQNLKTNIQEGWSDAQLKGLSKINLNIKIDIVNQLQRINQFLVKEFQDVEAELSAEFGLSATDKDRLRGQKIKLATVIQAQQKFAIEIANFIKEMDFRRIVMEEINEESPQTAERIYARLRNKL